MDKSPKSKATASQLRSQKTSTMGSQMITLRSKDNKLIKLDHRIAQQSYLISGMIEDRQGSTDLNSEDEAIPLNFDEKLLLKVFEYMKYEYEVEKLPELPRPLPTDRLQDSMPQWFAQYINMQNLEEIYDVIAAANYLDVPSLVELGCAKVGAMMKNKTIPELRRMFSIVNDFTPEEERTILEGKADIWGDEDDEGDENEQTTPVQGNLRNRGNQEEYKISK